ncbi:hypothetical protein G4B88_020155 [Cannabis sativa]|uniref:Uncharacterized protein n=1 Tax=Cannabis sativa TaxID=3483 RepID=A0A7J6EJ57_CANSA|nr:hypothetical protein G4B88_020155 [Cannabis sativa]
MKIEFDLNRRIGVLLPATSFVLNAVLILENNKQQSSEESKYFVLVWRHGRVVRWGTANSFSPVQIRVPLDQQKN